MQQYPNQYIAGQQPQQYNYVPPQQNLSVSGGQIGISQNQPNQNLGIYNPIAAQQP